MIVKGYRFVTQKLQSEHGNVKWKVGEWQKHDSELKLCQSGFHASEDPLHSLNYIYGARWFKCEARGKILHDTDKFCAEEMRIVKEIPVSVINRFAIDCAKHVLHIYEKEYPDDKRPREAIEAAEAYLADSSEENLKKLYAARDAAWAAAWAAARDAAWAAAWDAAWDAWDAAWDAGDAERKWQHKHLKKLIKEGLANGKRQKS